MGIAVGEPREMGSVQCMLALDKVTRADFEPALEQDFELITGTGGISLKLVEIESRSGEGHATRAEPFVLRFQGVPELQLPQSIYRLQNLTLGPMEIFLVQIAGGEKGSLFEAVFN
jgi:hypothetical protein